MQSQVKWFASCFVQNKSWIWEISCDLFMNKKHLHQMSVNQKLIENSLPLLIYGFELQYFIYNSGKFCHAWRVWALISHATIIICNSGDCFSKYLDEHFARNDHFSCQIWHFNSNTHSPVKDLIFWRDISLFHCVINVWWNLWYENDCSFWSH